MNTDENEIQEDNNSIEKDNEVQFIEDNEKAGRFILAIGSKGGGKSHLMTSFLKFHLLENTYEYIHFCCPCYGGEADDQYAFLKDQKQVLIYKHYNAKISTLVDKDRQKGKTLFLIDDGSSELISNIDTGLIHLITTARHYKSCTLYFALHSSRKVMLPIVRQSVDHMFIYKIINAGLLRDLYDEYFSMLFNKWQEFKDFYNNAIAEKYSCIHFSIHFKGLDIGVKDWEINRLRDKYTLKPHKAIHKPKPKETKEKPQTGHSISSLFYKKGRK